MRRCLARCSPPSNWRTPPYEADTTSVQRKVDSSKAKTDAELEGEMQKDEQIKVLKRKTETLKRETDRLTKMENELKEAASQKDEMLAMREETIDKLQATIEQMMNAGEGQRVKIDDKLLHKGPKGLAASKIPQKQASQSDTATPVAAAPHKSSPASAPAAKPASIQVSAEDSHDAPRNGDAQESKAKMKGMTGAADATVAEPGAGGDFYDNGIDFAGESSAAAGMGEGKGAQRGTSKHRENAHGKKPGGAESVPESLSVGEEDTEAPASKHAPRRPKKHTEDASGSLKKSTTPARGRANDQEDEDGDAHSQHDLEEAAEKTSQHCLKIRDRAWTFHQQVVHRPLSVAFLCCNLAISDSHVRFDVNGIVLA